MVGPSGSLERVPAPGSLMYAFGNGYFSNMVYGNAAWNYKSFHENESRALAEKTTAVALDANQSRSQGFRESWREN